MKTRLAVLLPLLALLLGLLASTGTAAQAVPTRDAATSARGASFQIPAVGACYDYSATAAAKRSQRSAPVSCEGPHTAQTLAVAKVRSPRSERAEAAATAKCAKVLRRTVGSALARTAYTYRYFVPSTQQVRKGARWVRCDLVLAGGRTLLPVTTPLVSEPLTDAVELCAVTVKGISLRTACSEKHDYRFTSAYQAKGKKYPGRTKLLRSVVLTCAKKVSTPKKFWAFYPDAADWRAGRRDVSCLSQTRA